MLLPQEYYNKIYQELEAFDLELQALNLEIEEEKRKATELKAENESTAKVEMEENSRLILKVRAFIDIAAPHAARLEKSVVPITYDSGVLARLSVQINSSSLSDPFAEKLYKEATGQLLYLENNTSAISERCRRRNRDVDVACDEVVSQAEIKKQNVVTRLKKYFDVNEDVKALADIVGNDGNVFGNTVPLDAIKAPEGRLSFGVVKMPVPKNSHIIEALAKRFVGYCDTEAGSINIPVGLSMKKGGVIFAQYSNDSEAEILSGIRNLLLNVARYYRNLFDKVVFIDPVRFSNNTLGCLSALADGNNSFIDPVPLSAAGVKKKIQSLIDIETSEELEAAGMYKRKLYVFHDFPQSYDSDEISKIQQLCVNSEHYEAIVILTSNSSGKAHGSNELVDYLRLLATCIPFHDNAFKMIAPGTEDTLCDFKWYDVPENLPEDVVDALVKSRPTVDTNNEYGKRIGFDAVTNYRKGVRKIEKIPYAIDDKGNVLTLSFEDSNFATFICGASRSGKSTLLHTLITGILKNNHPDDIEIWLIDFKMTEFSRYTKDNLPPHIRYVILDESPELVYDIIDRLTEIMMKRQSMFMGKWEKLSKVPPEKYMPALFIIIDEFAVMSNIIADSAVSGRDNYVIKMQLLLAKGAALGMHFLFSSQGFTTGTRGLNDYAKKQVQQRVAMKTEFGEIKETLDLKSASDNDRFLIEQLPVYHALTRIPMDEKGNHLRLGKVIYIPDYTEQEKMISEIRKYFQPKPKYDSTDVGAYIYKKPMIIDGNSYVSYDSKLDDIEAHIKQNRDLYIDDDTVSMFIGEPQRMLHVYSIEIIDGFCENVLLIASRPEKVSASSVIITAMKSLKLHDTITECWSTRKNAIYRHLGRECKFGFDEAVDDIDLICDRIRALKKAIASKSQGNKMIVLLGFETILMDMSYIVEEDSDYSYDDTGITEYSHLISNSFSDIELDEGEEDVSSFISDMLLSIGENPDEIVAEVQMHGKADERVPEHESKKEKYGFYDAREDLKYIITHGPRYGYHFMMVYNTISEFEQSKLSTSLFKHKIFFRTAKSEATRIVSSFTAGVISELKDHVYRYTDGLDEISFRPYLHDGIVINGWTLVDGEVINITSEEEEYLQ